ALRKNPALAGKVVLQLTIAPSGEVTACEIVSSELQDPLLERKLVARVLLFDFGEKDVPEVTISYPLEFFPS
ncbi:MAG: AgmX/PglI C-terminal domain-containing protein, partial [Gammaproteobacteria bacterium]